MGQASRTEAHPNFEPHDENAIDSESAICRHSYTSDRCPSKMSSSRSSDTSSGCTFKPAACSVRVIPGCRSHSKPRPAQDRRSVTPSSTCCSFAPDPPPHMLLSFRMSTAIGSRLVCSRLPAPNMFPEHVASSAAG